MEWFKARDDDSESESLSPLCGYRLEPDHTVQLGGTDRAWKQRLASQTEATVSYAGLAPGAVGSYQFNVVVPNVTASDNVPVTFS